MKAIIYSAKKIETETLYTARPSAESVAAQLMAHPNVLITPHQGFITIEALKNTADQTIQGLNEWELELEYTQFGLAHVDYYDQRWCAGALQRHL